MSTYAIGDVQGCYDELMRLLDVVQFNSTADTLWFVGDLVNRGPDSLSVLRFVKSVKNKKVVLGNHDLHLLAVANGAREKHEGDTLDAILAAEDSGVLLGWLRQQPLIYHDEKFNTVMVHAGIPPQWDLEQAKQCALEVEDRLKSKDAQALFSHMYGNEPSYWQTDLAGWERYRYIINSLTRMRYCDESNQLDFETIAADGSQKKGLIPWFDMPEREKDEFDTVFGHWAFLKGKTNRENKIGLDTGCVWGGELTAFRLDDKKYFKVKKQ